MASIDITVVCAAGRIATVRVRARTPNPAPVLYGLAPRAVAGVLGRLYAICGAAQRACAELALAAAEAQPLVPDRYERLASELAAEAIQEHVWRLWLDWPKALQLEPLHAAFTSAYGAIQSDARDWPARLAESLARDWLGRPLAALDDFASLEAFDRWSARDPSPAARLFAALRAEPAAAPRAGAGAAEGAEAAGPDAPGQAWLAALGRDGRLLEARLATRVVALAALLAALHADTPVPIALESSSAEAGRGVASVPTARGRLLHDVVLDAGHVAYYAIRTPTQRHFAVDGPFSAAVRGRAAADAAAGRRVAALWALGFDPCVSYAVEGDRDA